MMLDWVPDEAARKRIFLDNPAEIFGFPPLAPERGGNDYSKTGRQ
jgi:hypothetical protein